MGFNHVFDGHLLVADGTDASIDADVLRGMLQAATDVSFNCISIDGDTSTNDAVLILANGASEVDVTRDADTWPRFAEAVLPPGHCWPEDE